mgnify:CR=1 FL=1
MYLLYTKFSLPTHGSASMHSSSDSGYDCLLFSHIPSDNGNSGYGSLLSSHIPSDNGNSGYDCLLFSPTPSGNGNSGYDCLLFSPIPSGNGNSGYNCLLFSPIPSGNGNSGYDCLLFSPIPSDVKKGSACAVLPSSLLILDNSKTPKMQITVVQNAPDHKQRTLEPPVLSSRTVGTYASVACGG